MSTKRPFSSPILMDEEGLTKCEEEQCTAEKKQNYISKLRGKVIELFVFWAKLSLVKRHGKNTSLEFSYHTTPVSE